MLVCCLFFAPRSDKPNIIIGIIVIVIVTAVIILVTGVITDRDIGDRGEVGSVPAMGVLVTTAAPAMGVPAITAAKAIVTQVIPAVITAIDLSGGGIYPV